MFDEDVQNHMGTTGAQFMSYERYAKTSHQKGVRQHLHHRAARR